MTARIVLAVAAVAAFVTTGCGVAYTSIRQEPDGSYVLTGAHSGLFTVSGTVYRCKAEGQRLHCQETAEN